MWRILNVAMSASQRGRGVPRVPAAGAVRGRDRGVANVVISGGVLAGGRCRHSTCWGGRNRMNVDRGCSGDHGSRGCRGSSDRPTRCLNRVRPVRVAALCGLLRCAGQSEVSNGCFPTVFVHPVSPLRCFGDPARGLPSFEGASGSRVSRWFPVSPVCRWRRSRSGGS